MKKQMMFHTFPYKIGDFRANVREYGLRNALIEDWYMTREDIDHEVKPMVVLGSIMLLAEPVILCLTAGIVIEVIKESRKNKRLENLAFQ